jgi:hypothetical protein
MPRHLRDALTTTDGAAARVVADGREVMRDWKAIGGKIWGAICLISKWALMAFGVLAISTNEYDKATTIFLVLIFGELSGSVVLRINKDDLK